MIRTSQSSGKINKYDKKELNYLNLFSDVDAMIC